MHPCHLWLSRKALWASAGTLPLPRTEQAGSPPERPPVGPDTKGNGTQSAPLCRSPQAPEAQTKPLKGMVLRNKLRDLGGLSDVTLRKNTSFGTRWPWGAERVYVLYIHRVPTSPQRTLWAY